MLQRLEAIYPGMGKVLEELRDDEERTRFLLWDLPDGKYEGDRGVVGTKHHLGLTEGQARVKATSAILRFLHLAHGKHEALSAWYEPWT